ncbi:MAG: N-6 DNA methylase [Sulfuritalea sp.]|nr:N-6 DNA methylase [Sulfuritalea sp.]
MNLQHINEWRSHLGYLPVPLRYGSNEQRFVMLNGAKGNFCLDIDEELVPPFGRRDIAWSADVDHYVRVTTDGVEVLRWDRPELLRSSVAEVTNNLRAFQQYLDSTRTPREQSIVAHAVGIYNRIRAALPDGAQGLEAFLYVLQESLTRSQSSIGDLQWGDRLQCQEAWQRIGAIQRDRIVGDLARPRASEKHVDIVLMLRHAMGRIFQETHNIVAISPQMSLLGEDDLIVTGSKSRFSGAYFTPTPLVRTLVEQCLTPELLSKEELVILDAACGSGEFLRECARQLDLNGFQGRARFIGYDISPHAILMARFGMATEIARHGSRFTIEIEQRDALSADWPSDTSICLMNPPYASWGSLSATARDRLADILGDLAGIRPDLAFAFLVKASACLARGGTLGAVIPASLLDGDSAAKLRARLDENLDRRVIVRLGNQSIFDAATVDVSLYVAKRSDTALDQRPPTLMVWADHTSNAADQALRTLRSLGRMPGDDVCEINQQGFSIYTEPKIADTESAWAPRPAESRRLISEFSSLPRLSKLYRINQGAITGLNSAFLLNAENFKQLPRTERKYFRPAIVNASITDGCISEGHWVFYPYGAPSLEIVSEDALEDKLPVYLQEFLAPNRGALLKRAGVDVANWWGLTRNRTVFEKKTPKLVSTYFGSSGSFAWDSTGEFVVVQGYAWSPKVPELDEDRIGYATAAALGSEIAKHLIAAISNNLAGGQFNLSARFMGRMPFVNMANEDLSAFVDELALIGTAMSKASAYSAELRDRLTGELFSQATRLRG